MQSHGSLAETPLRSLLESAQGERSTGTLTIRNGNGQSASLYFLFGHLFHAQGGDGKSGDDAVVNALREDPTLRVNIEGHTCNIGTAEYNLALGDRRATSVRDYLVSRGIAANRLTTVSYGEERPKYDNSREETRRLNRRAALVVNLQR